MDRVYLLYFELNYLMLVIIINYDHFPKQFMKNRFIHLESIYLINLNINPYLYCYKLESQHLFQITMLTNLYFIFKLRNHSYIYSNRHWQNYSVLNQFRYYCYYILFYYIYLVIQQRYLYNLLVDILNHFMWFLDNYWIKMFNYLLQQYL